MTRKFWKRAVLLSAALLSVGGTARAEDECSNATLKGLYGFSLRGEFIGFFDADGNPQRIPNPDIIDAVFIQKFDGTGAFTRSDYVSSDGFKRPGLTDPTTGFDTGKLAHTPSSRTARASCTLPLLLPSLPPSSTFDSC